ncbi:MAG: DUF99 family protein [Candidatus Thermoplasmatota archaeon]|nr:DUF99 family protein [Candidatus Thermoplasmatota archaeon]
MIKPGSLVLGIDDGPFIRGEDKHCMLIGTLMRLDFRTVGFISRSIELDGEDVTDSVISMITGTRHRGIHAVMTNGVTFGGMNILDVLGIHGQTGIPVISISRRLPDIDAMKNAILKHNPQKWGQVNERLSSRIFEVNLENGSSLHANFAGIDAEDAFLLIKKMTKSGNIPEPIRLSHMIASALYYGESRGKP